jgi:hypothetical protein
MIIWDEDGRRGVVAPPSEKTLAKWERQYNRAMSKASASPRFNKFAFRVVYKGRVYCYGYSEADTLRHMRNS